MVTLNFFETAIDSIFTYLKANFATRLGDIDTAHAGDPAMGVPAAGDYYDYEQGDPTSYPAIILLGDRLPIIGGDFGTIRTQEFFSLFLWTYNDTDEALFRRVVYRYASAIWISLRAWETTQSNYSIGPEAAFEFELIDNPDERKTWAGFRLQFMLTRHENLT